MSTSESGSRGSQAGTDAQRTIQIGNISTEQAWKLATAVALALVLGFLFLDLLQLLIRPIGILFAGMVVAITLAPIANWLEQWLPRIVAVLLVYFGLMIILIGIGFIIVPPFVMQMTNLVQSLPDYYTDAQVWLARELGVTVRNDMDQLAAVAEPLADQLIAVPTFIIGAGIEFLVGFFVSLYWLHSMPRIKAFTVSLFPPERQRRVDVVLMQLGQRMGGYMRGVALAGAVVGVAVYIGLSVLGIQYALVLAIIAFLGEFFPNVGPVLAGIPAVAIALFESPEMALVVLIFYIVIQQIESYILMPVIMSVSLAHIPPLVTTFAVFTGFMVGGVLWAILAIPLSGAILTLTTEVIAPAIRRKTGASEPEEESQGQDTRVHAPETSRRVRLSDGSQ